jgi:hypothetical protein
MKHPSALVATALLFLVCCGCGNSSSVPLGTVSGQVTLDGKPLPNVSVTFIPVVSAASAPAGSGGGSSSGITDASGNYELNYQADGSQGATIGKHKVSVTTVRQAPAATAQMSSDSPEYAQQASGGGDYSKQWTEPIPEQYNSKTTLEHEVKSGSNTIDLELKSS